MVDLTKISEGWIVGPVVDLLARLVAPLNHVLFTMGADAVSWAELLGFVTGAACVTLTVRASIHNFWVGIANSTFFLVLFASARLWADSGLQVVYLVLGFVGWWQWLHARQGGQRRTGRAAPATLAGGLVFIVVGTWGLTILLRDAHDIAPFWDALTTAISLVAQYLLNTKRVETWLFWITADVIYVPLYAVKHLDLTAIVYVAFLGLSVTGLLQWRALERSERRDKEPAGSALGAPGRITPETGVVA